MTADDFFEDFDDLTRRISRARYRDIDRLAAEWFDIIEDGPPPVVDAYRRLLSMSPWDEVKSQIEVPGGSMVGSSEHKWPRDRERKLSSQLNLFRHLVDTETEIWSYFHNYFYSGSNQIDDGVRMMTEHLWDPFARDLRRTFERSIASQSSEATAGLADDRIIAINRNTEEADVAEKSIQRAEEAISSSNAISEVEKDRIIAELRAGRELLKSTTVRLQALQSVLLSALRWVATQFAETAAGTAATAAITLIVSWLGFG